MGQYLIHENTKESVVRLYKACEAITADEAYRSRKPYIAEFVIDWLTPEVVYVSGFMSQVRLQRSDISDLKQYARDRGVKELWHERGGRIEVEFL